MSVSSVQAHVSKRSPVTVTSQADCGLCLQSSPRLLPCSHSFCLSCIGQLVQSAVRRPGGGGSSGRGGGSGGAAAASGSFPCPTCLSPTHIFPPLGGVSDGRGSRNSTRATTAGFDWELVAAASARSWQTREAVDLPKFSAPLERQWGFDGSGNFGDSLGSGSDRSGHSTSSSSRASSGAGAGSTCMSAAEDEQEDEDSLRMTTRATAVPERTCPQHPGERLRFYCTRCRSPVCRDCKLSSHEGHRAVSLLQKSQDVQSLVATVTEMSLASLKPKLEQSLRDVEKHRQLTEKTQAKIRDKLQRRAEDLKKVVDRSVAQALDQLDRMAAAVDEGLGATADDMTQGLVTLVSFAEHVQSVADTGRQADVVELVPLLKRFFLRAISGQQTSAGGGGEDFEILEEDDYDYDYGTTTTRRGSGGDGSGAGGVSLGADGVLGSFLGEDWRAALQLSDPSTPLAKECPFCAHKYSTDAAGFTCPKCCSPKSDGGGSSKTYCPKNLFGLRGRRSAAGSCPQLQCQGCRLRYSATFEFCPSCGLPHSQDALSAVKTFVPQYLGHVIQTTHQSEGLEGESGGQSPGVQEIFNIITTVSKLLEEFQ